MSDSDSLSERLSSRLQQRVQSQKDAPVATERYQWADTPDSNIGEATTRALTEKRFPCGQCGAVLNYAIGTRSLECDYCGHSNAIEQSLERLVELDFHDTLIKLQQSAKVVVQEEQSISCPNCAAHFDLAAHIHAGECPFCGTDVVTETSSAKIIKPKGLLPFEITAEQARASYKQWLNKRWFAPSELKKYARDDATLNGVYIPYWTYDSDTVTAYEGQRGEVYYVSQRYSTTVNGRRVTRTRQVPKVRWYRASGRTSRHFDDVLVGATKTLPRKITDWLAPWDLQNLVPYREDYLAGFSSEVYQVDLDDGFSIAQATMDNVIRGDVKHAIGGDQQRIHQLNTRHSDTTFKHVLLPLWTAGFQFRGKTYRFVVNGRTGKVRGERPYSIIKIAFAAIAAVLLLVAALFVVESSQGMGSSRGGFTWGASSESGMGWRQPPDLRQESYTPLHERFNNDTAPRVLF